MTEPTPEGFTAADVIRALADVRCPRCGIAVTELRMTQDYTELAVMGKGTPIRFPSRRFYSVGPCGDVLSETDGQRLAEQARRLADLGP
ncbi:MAG: hypothetical protein ACE5Q3_11950 [Alphaproteobacteria bacterium]